MKVMGYGTKKLASKYNGRNVMSSITKGMKLEKTLMVL